MSHNTTTTTTTDMIFLSPIWIVVGASSGLRPAADVDPTQRTRCPPTDVGGASRGAFGPPDRFRIFMVTPPPPDRLSRSIDVCCYFLFYSDGALGLSTRAIRNTTSSSSAWNNHQAGRRQSGGDAFHRNQRRSRRLHGRALHVETRPRRDPIRGTVRRGSCTARRKGRGRSVSCSGVRV